MWRARMIRVIGFAAGRTGPRHNGGNGYNTLFRRSARVWELRAPVQLSTYAPPMKRLLRIVWKTAAWGALLGAAAAIGLGVYAATLLPTLPTVADIRRVPLNIPLRIYSSDDKLIAEYGDERRSPVTLDQTPPLLIDAILVTEDDRFYHHSGVDFRGIVRAGISNFFTQSRAQGASTITMQVARNFFLKPDKTYTRKLKEILLAFKLERALTKDEILALYLNKIFLGHRAYGFAAASQVYYGVDLSDLSVPEIAMLAGLPKAPSRNNPLTDPARATERRDYVLRRLHELGRIDDLSYRTATDAPVTAARRIAERQAQAPYAAEMVRQMLFERFGRAAYQDGYRVTVTIHSEYQSRADDALRRGLLAYDKRHGFRGPVDALDLEALSPADIDNALRNYPHSGDVIPAVVLSGAGRSIAARIIGRDINIDWQHIEWARAHQSPNSLGPELTAAAEVVSRGDVVYVAPVAGRAGRGWGLSQLPDVGGALVCIDPNSGAVRALAGGFDYYLSKFNRAAQALRQPGSNFKPFIYSAALEHGFTAGSLVSAAPIVVADDLEGVWRPQNYSGQFFGPTRLREALSRSLNLVAVRLLRAIGIDAAIAHLAKFGFDPATLPRSYSLALGSFSVTPLDLAAGFAVFANGGRRVQPYLIERIEDADGETVALAGCDGCLIKRAGGDGVLDAAGDGDGDGDSDSDGEAAGEVAAAEDAGPADTAAAVDGVEVANAVTDTVTVDSVTADTVADGESDRVISEQNAFLMTEMMREVIRSGTGRRALALERGDLAGKTGTTNDFRDAWFSGFNADLVATVYVGFDEPAHLGRRESGATAALPIWVDYMRAVLPDFPARESPPPDGIVTRLINKNTGQPAAADDPDGYLEYYIAGSEPAAAGPGGERAGEALF